MIASQTQSALATDNWRHRRGQEWALSYWNSITRPHRGLLLQALQQVEPFGSVVELGCGSAPCLRLIQARYPGTRCYGIDINVQMLLTAFEQAGLEGWDRYLDLEHNDLINCDVPAAGVVFSSYALAYVCPEEIAAVVTRMLTAAARAVVFVEPTAGDGRSHYLEAPGRVPEWAHPYAELVTAHVGWTTAWIELTPPEGLLNGALLARRTHMFNDEGDHR